jgi:hypothetical protein
MPDFFNGQGFELLGTNGLEFLFRLFCDVLTLIILVRGIYIPKYRRTNVIFTFFSMNIVIFLIGFLLNKVEMTMGAAFGLFAVFSMLRFRTENISARDMTYVFIVIAVGLLVSVSRGGWQEMLLICGVIVLSTSLLEKGLFSGSEDVREILYERIELIHPDRRQELIEDLRNRTGLDIRRVEIGDIDLLKDAARLTVYYLPHPDKSSDQR